ncbi:hypothetical protein C0989_010704, partial [Termitomyces sp. Mn162]
LHFYFTAMVVGIGDGLEGSEVVSIAGCLSEMWFVSVGITLTGESAPTDSVSNSPSDLYSDVVMVCVRFH